MILYLNKQHFCFGNLYILIIHFHFLYLTCSQACHHIPHSLYPFPTDGHLAHVFIYLFVYLLIYWLYANYAALKSVKFLFPKAHILLLWR